MNATQKDGNSVKKTIDVEIPKPYPPGIHPAVLIIGALERHVAMLSHDLYKKGVDDAIDMYHQLFESVVAATTAVPDSLGTTERVLAFHRQTRGHQEANSELARLMAVLDVRFIVYVDSDESIFLKHENLEIRAMKT